MNTANYGITFFFYVSINILGLYYLKQFDTQIYFLIDSIKHNFFASILIILLSLSLYIVIHESGHILIGLILSFNLLECNIWFFSIKKDILRKKFVYQIKPTRILSFNGSTYMNSSKLTFFSLRQFLYLIGGIFFNLVSIFLIILYYNYRTINNVYLKEFIYIFGLLSIILILINLIPLYPGVEKLQDGRKIYNLFFIPSFKNYLILDTLDIQGIRPREWLKFNIFPIAKKSQINDFDLILKLNEFISHIDNRNVEKANKIAEELLKSIKYAPIDIHDLILIYISFYFSIFLDEPKMASQFLNQLRNKFKPSILTQLFSNIILALAIDQEHKFQDHKNRLQQYYEKSIRKGTSSFFLESLALLD